MAEDEAAAETPPKRSKLPILLGLVLMVLLGGGAFLATYTGRLFGASGPAPTTSDPAGDSMADVAFVPIDPLVISLDPAARSSHLRFSAQLEVDKAHRGEVATLMPRVLDVLNSYLRAVEVSDLEDPSALVRLRAQMLRRVQIVAGEGRVRDLLVTEFVLN
ncbi:MAG: flagellar basal body protein FliL [Rhodobacteraceae bacterium]|nr:flagellar basal body protein FliL [Paracoccaceae bacterium]